MQSLQKTTVLLQMDDLLNEIRQLKDELRKKDETINQLEQQLVSITQNVYQNPRCALQSATSIGSTDEGLKRA